MDFESRRNKLFDLMEENSVALVFSGVSKVSSEDEFYPFVVNRSFFYLTGIKQENSMLLMIKGIGEQKTYLFIDEYNELKEKWTGKRITPKEASETSKITNVYTNTTLDSMLTLALAKTNNQYGHISTLYLDLTPEEKIGDSVTTIDLGKSIDRRFDHISVKNVKPLVTKLRMIKSSEEIECLRRAIDLTNQAINNLIVNMKVGQYEYSLADMFEYYGREHGQAELSFPTIVAAGKNSTCLHYPSQQCQICEGDIVLFDLGLRDNLYCADISRTFPINGVYDEKQRAVYEAVLNCNKALIQYARPGLTISDLQDYASTFLKNECLRLKLLKPEDDIRSVYFHSCSHHLGLDTHDTSDRNMPLEPGNVITIEPGLYFSDLNVGVRIEDDILITTGSAECLSQNIIKEISDIERAFKMKG